MALRILRTMLAAFGLVVALWIASVIIGYPVESRQLFLELIDMIDPRVSQLTT